MGKHIDYTPMNQRSKPKSGKKKVVEISNESPPASSAGLEAIQDILFGEQLRSSNEQIIKLQQNGEESLANLSDSFDRRFEELTNTMNLKFESLAKQLKSQENTQQSDVERFMETLSVTKAELTQSIDSSREALDATREELNEQIRKITAEMDSKKLDRGKLSELFKHAAQELAADVKLPTAQKS